MKLLCKIKKNITTKCTTAKLSTRYKNEYLLKWVIKNVTVIYSFLDNDFKVIHNLTGSILAYIFSKLYPHPPMGGYGYSSQNKNRASFKLI